MPLTSLWEALGGLGLFLLGMKSLSEGLQKLAGGRVRQLLEKVTGNRLTAALAGSCLASLLQSSSAAAILVIGFTNAGLISLYQALGVLLGTGIGSTLAIQFIALRISSVALPAIFAGVVLKFFVRSRRWSNMGDLLLGAGLVFWGLQMLEYGFVPIKQSTLFQSIHNHYFNWRISSVLLGALFTFLVQSSSAAAGIVIAVTGSGLFNLQDGVAMIIGEVLGTTAIAAIASINGTIAAKRTAFAYFVMNAMAIVLVLIFFQQFLHLVTFVTPGVDVTTLITPVSGTLVTPTNQSLFRCLANAHTLFSFINALLFLPLIGMLARSATTMLPGREGDGDSEPRAKFIDIRVVNTPTIALLQAKRELQRMADIARTMYFDVVKQLYSFNVKSSARIRRKEAVLDILQREISGFLVLLSRRQFNADNAMELPILLHIVNNLEHIGDQNEALLNYLDRKKEREVFFSDTAMSELKVLAQQVGEIVNLSVDSLGNASENDLVAARALKDTIATQSAGIANQHVERLTRGECTVLAGVVFNDILSAFMKITEYSYNIMKMDKGLV